MTVSKSHRWTGVAVAYLILLVSFAVGLWSLERRDIERTETAALAGCERVNVLRGAINDISLLASVAYRQGAQREAALAKTDRNRDLHRRAAERLRELGRGYVYRPLTNCPAAVKAPKTYTVPPSRAFTEAELRSRTP